MELNSLYSFIYTERNLYGEKYTTILHYPLHIDSHGESAEEARSRFLRANLVVLWFQFNQAGFHIIGLGQRLFQIGRDMTMLIELTCSARPTVDPVRAH